jgi:hypothetical protein
MPFGGEQADSSALDSRLDNDSPSTARKTRSQIKLTSVTAGRSRLTYLPKAVDLFGQFLTDAFGGCDLLHGFALRSRFTDPNLRRSKFLRF